jgi:eukaryotic-like serine/threonine-protein kinase
MSGPDDPVPLRLGPYELIERVATGGMAEVYLARRAGPHGFQKVVAVKRILPQLAKDVDFVAMFVDEARVCARLSHPNIVQVFDFGEEEGELYMAMEYVDGTTGARLIRAAATKGVELPLDACLHVALSLLRGLEYAHAARDEAGKPLSLVHRDVSPGNVLIDRSGAVKLTDFGIARAAELERRTDAGQLKGKLGYMSPEQVVGRELDARSDLFTLGIVLAEMVILRPLFSGGTELEVLLRIRDADLSALDKAKDRVPQDLRAVLYRALAKDPMLRYANAGAFADAIEDLVRRRRLQVGPAKLAVWIERLGLTPVETVDPVTGEVSRRTTAILSAPPGKLDVRESQKPGPISENQDVSPQVYRTKQPDGTLAGPMSYPRLVELFATGKVGPKTLISRENARFQDAQLFTEFARFVTSPALRWDDEFPRDAKRRGPIVRATLPTYLFDLALARATGVLVLFGDGTSPASPERGPHKDAHKKKIYLVEGVPEFVASTDKKELLGEHLIARGQVLRMEVEMALAMLPRFGGRIGDALVGLGVLRPIELFRAIHDQTQDRYVSIFKWTAGEMGFVDGARSQEETFPLGVDPFDLIGRGVRAGYASAELRSLLGALGETPIEPVASPPVRLESFRLPEREVGVLRGIVRPVPLARVIAERCVRGEADVEEVMRAVFLGLSCGLLRCEAWGR